jgi:hypothetical protein
LKTIEQMTDNPGYLTPAIALASLTEAAETFMADVAAALDGGRLATATKNASRAGLILLLRQQAAYVQSVAGTDLALLLSSGFQAISTNRAQIVLPQAVIKTVGTPQSTKLSTTVNPLKTARGYEVRYKTETGEYLTARFSTSSRNILIEGLTPGVVYTVQARAVGGLTGYGDWSNPVSRMAI